MQKFLILALCVAVCSAVSPFTSSVASISPKGVVGPINRCGGVGTFKELRVASCEGICNLVPGNKYDIECDLIPSSASPSLSLRLLAKVFGTEVLILEAVLPNSSVQPGIQYTIIFALTPNDLLSGQTVTLISNIFHSNTGLLELCIENDVRIN